MAYIPAKWRWLPYLPHPGFLCAGLSVYQRGRGREKESEGREIERNGAQLPLSAYIMVAIGTGNRLPNPAPVVHSNTDIHTNKNTHCLVHTHTHTHTGLHSCIVEFHSLLPGGSVASLFPQSGKLEHNYTRMQWPRLLMYLSFSCLCFKRCWATVSRARGGGGCLEATIKRRQ